MTQQDAVVFIVDDDDVIRSSLSRALEMRGFTTRSFASAASFLDAYDDTQPGCLVLDYGMPEMSGLELQDVLLERGHRIPTIFITGHGGVSESVRAMKGGALDFLEKPFRQETLVERIREALEKDARARKGRFMENSIRSNFDRLTDREKEITELLVTNPSSTSSKQVARALDISPRTVDHHRARILEKMEVTSVVELVDRCNSTNLFPRNSADRIGPGEPG